MPLKKQPDWHAVDIRKIGRHGDTLNFEPYYKTDKATKQEKLLSQNQAPEPSSRKTRLSLRVTAIVLVGILVQVIIWLVLTHKSKNASPINYALNFPKLYPTLDVSRSTKECREAWDTLTAVPCHEGIWVRDWDYGSVELHGSQIMQLLPLICNDECAAHLKEAQTLLRASCQGENAFALDIYRGRMNTTVLESTPRDAVDVLVERHAKSCAKSPLHDAEGGGCMSDLESRWGFIDGIRTDGLEGLDRFIAATSTWEHLPQHHLVIDGIRQFDDFVYGPGKGETTCSWCTQRWLSEKVWTWEENKIFRNGSALMLPEFLRMWERAGRRCTGEQFSTSYKAAIKAYQAQGLLAQIWTRRPSGNISYLLENGPVAGDYPISEALNLVSLLTEYRDNNKEGDAATPALLELVNEYITCLDAFQLEVQSLGSYPFLSYCDITTYFLSDLQTAKRICSSENSQWAMTELEQKLSEKCPSSRMIYAKWITYDLDLRYLFDVDQLPFSLGPIFGWQGTVGIFSRACQTSDPTRVGGPPCAAVFAQWGMQKWAWLGAESKELIRTTRHLITALPSMPKKLQDFYLDRQTGKLLPSEEQETLEEFYEWQERMEEGVCSNCLWRKFVPAAILSHGYMYWDESDQVNMELIVTIHLLRDECAARGKEFDSTELEKVDEHWKLFQKQELWDEAFREGRKGPEWLKGPGDMPSDRLDCY